MYAQSNYMKSLLHTLYFLQMLKLVYYIPQDSSNFPWRVLVAVAVSAITGTPSGSRLRISPRRNSTPRKVSPVNYQS